MNMKPLSLEKIAEVTGGRYVGDPSLASALITGVVRDNREVSPGNLFVCIKGARVDGHDFADAAFDADAACCLTERELALGSDRPQIIVEDSQKALMALAEYYRSLFEIPIIGVIGSVGKTTAKEMVAAVLSRNLAVFKTPANLNNELGVPLSLLGLRDEHDAAVIEMGISDFGEMARLAKMVRPNICLMTAIGYCHLEKLGDLDGVLRAKSEVFEYMAEDGFAVVNGDDPLLASFDPGVMKLTYGLSENNHVHAEMVESRGFGGMTCRIHNRLGDEFEYTADIPAYGSHMAIAAAGAALIGKIFDIEPDEIARGIADYYPVGGRSRVIDTGYIKIIDDCYNANPNSVTSAILSLAALGGRRVAILGDMKELGREERELHREIGVLASTSGIDSIICCGNLAEYIYKGHISSGIKTEAWQFPMKEALLSVLPSLIKKDDTVLVKASHSMHFEEIVAELEKLS